MSHYFTNDPSLKKEEKTTSAIIRGQKYSFITDNGVFAKKGLDFGTRALLETLPLEKIQGRVLDFGCGYGPIAIFLKKNCDVQVDAIDINERSLHLTVENAKLNRVEIHSFISNQYEKVEGLYDFIVTNPPIRVGKKILYEILFKAKEYLKDKGELWLVIHKDQGAKSLVHDLTSTYQVEVKDKVKGFFIICCTKWSE